MGSRSLSRELALLVLGQLSDRDHGSSVKTDSSLESLLEQALDGLNQHWRDVLDASADDLEKAQQCLLACDPEHGNRSATSLSEVRDHLNSSLIAAEQVLNGLSASLELPRLLLLADQEQIRRSAMERAKLVMNQRDSIDAALDQVMEGWRLTRLPRIDRDILRLAVVDLQDLKTPAPVAFSEAVELANRYSDEQGRRMINGVLRRFHDRSPTAKS